MSLVEEQKENIGMSVSVFIFSIKVPCFINMMCLVSSSVFCLKVFMALPVLARWIEPWPAD